METDPWFDILRDAFPGRFYRRLTRAMVQRALRHPKKLSPEEITRITVLIRPLGFARAGSCWTKGTEADLQQEREERRIGRKD